MRMAGSGTASTCSWVEGQLILEGVCTCTSEPVPPASVARGWVQGIWTRESNLFILSAVEPGSWSLVLPEATAPC